MYIANFGVLMVSLIENSGYDVPPLNMFRKFVQYWRLAIHLNYRLKTFSRKSWSVLQTIQAANHSDLNQLTLITFNI